MTHRKPPLSVERSGWCRWCDQTIEPRLKKDGQPHKIQASMHQACSDEYWKAQNASGFLLALKKRDGDFCASCDRKPDEVLEVDHKVPLWKVANLPASLRRAYFKLTNLWLLCSDCHKRKSAKEAAERAHHRRLVRGKKRRGAVRCKAGPSIRGCGGSLTGLWR